FGPLEPPEPLEVAPGPLGPPDLQRPAGPPDPRGPPGPGGNRAISPKIGLVEALLSRCRSTSQRFFDLAANLYCPAGVGPLRCAGLCGPSLGTLKRRSRPSNQTFFVNSSEVH